LLHQRFLVLRFHPRKLFCRQWEIWVNNVA
jgi:hypothetical protein